MTPAEHYARAELLLETAEKISDAANEASMTSVRPVQVDFGFILQAAQVHATLATYVDLDQPVRVVLPGPPPDPIPPIPGSVENGDRRPHSRACGIHSHNHGRNCSTNCPTCHGSIDETTWRPL